MKKARHQKISSFSLSGWQDYQGDPEYGYVAHQKSTHKELSFLFSFQF
jgi:hypothetical protein